MKISVSWLKEWVATLPDQLADRLTMAGLEVEAEELAAPEFTQVVVGEVKTVEPHPDADRLRVTTVDVGEDELLQIVCGAPNVAVGMKVPTAVVGAVLPGGFKIKAAKLRGVPSNGMLCSSKELGVDEDGSGLMALDPSVKVGTCFRELYDLDDRIVDVDLTPNRGDCLSILGVARDVAAISAQSIIQKEIVPVEVSFDEVKNITVENDNDCPRYIGRIVRDLNPNAETPLWMSERLRRCGIRPHGILVDVTNYVLLELGQPLHAFDVNKLEGDITVRRAKAGETLTLINDDKAELKDDTLVIADEKKVVAIAGIMGGKNSECGDDTTDVFLESAWFNPVTIAGRARNYGLHTDASHRFERGVDFALAEKALERATALLVEFAGGKAGKISRFEAIDALPKRDPIKVRFARVEKIIGKAFSKEEIVTYLERIGDLSEVADDHLIFTAPSYRFDIEIEEDLIEEIARLSGYNDVPVCFDMQSKISMRRVPENEVPLKDFKNILVARDYHEVIAMSFVSPKWQEILAPGSTPIALKNPISSDLSVMRTTLLPGVLGAMEHNLKRQHTRLRFFESGLTYNGTLENVKQELHLAGAICGEAFEKQWGEPARKLDFFDLKGDVEALLNRTGVQDFRFEASENSILHPGQSAQILTNAGTVVGYLGKLHPTVSKALDLNTDVFVFELNFNALKASATPTFSELSKFPSSRRDLALVVPNNVSHANLVDSMMQSGQPLLRAVNLFDHYQGAEKGEVNETRNVAYSLVFQNLKENLKDSEIDTIIESILNDLGKLDVQLRQ